MLNVYPQRSTKPQNLYHVLEPALKMLPRTLRLLRDTEPTSALPTRKMTDAARADLQDDLKHLAVEPLLEELPDPGENPADTTHDCDRMPLASGHRTGTHVVVKVGASGPPHCARIAHMTTDAAAVGARIAEARERARLTQQDLSADSGIERTALAKIERGLRGVSALELAALARALDMRIEWFVLDAPAALVSHRLRVGELVEVATIDRELERLARDVEMLASLDPHLISRVQEPLELPRSGEEAESLADKARQLCGLDAGKPVHDLVGALSEIGLLSFSRDLGSETADAGTILLERGAVALVNSANAVGRRRLALAHELGHYLLADDYTVDWRIAEHDSSDKTEAHIDRFARAFLAPSAGLTQQWRSLRADHSVRDAAVLTASNLRIDMSTLARRLQETGLATSDEYGEVRRARTKQADIVEHGLVVPMDLEGTSLPRRFTQSVIAQYRTQRISAERALSLLRGTFQPEDLPELSIAHESAIWDLIS